MLLLACCRVIDMWNNNMYILEWSSFVILPPPPSAINPDGSSRSHGTTPTLTEITGVSWNTRSLAETLTDMLKVLWKYYKSWRLIWPSPKSTFRCFLVDFWHNRVDWKSSNNIMRSLDSQSSLTKIYGWCSYLSRLLDNLMVDIFPKYNNGYRSYRGKRMLQITGRIQTG